MSTCEIRIVDGIPIVKTFPRLMREILTYTNFNIDQSMDLYGVTLLPEFQEMNISDPRLTNILSFVEQDNILEAGKLTKQDKQLLLDLSVTSSNIESDIKDLFVDTFSNSEGLFEVNVIKMKQNLLFSDSDILNIENNVKRLRDLYYKLNNNTLPEIPVLKTNIVISTDSNLGKQNPDTFLENSYENYTGLKSIREISDTALEIGDNTILNNPSLITVIRDQVQGKEKLIQYETDEYGSEIVRKVSNDISKELEQTLDMYQDFSDLISKVQLLRELDPRVYQTNPELILEHLKDTESVAAEMGLNIQGISEISYEKSSSEIVDFADSLYNFLVDIQSGNPDVESSMKEYVDGHTEFFQTSPDFLNKTVSEIESEGIFLHLETTLSEEEVFAKNGLLKTGRNVYQKISDNKDLPALYDLLLQNAGLLPNKVLSVSNKTSNRDMLLEDIDQYISNESHQYLTENSDIETIKKIVVYKILTGNTYQSEESKIYNGNLKLDAQVFLVNFNKYLLQNQDLKSIFYISNRGLESKRILGEYTARQLQNELPQATFQDLVKYAKISGNESLEYLTTFENEFKPSGNKRDFYANNLDQLPVYTLEYSNKNGYIVTDSSSDFIKIKNELYENVAPNIYAKIERDPRYMDSNLEKPRYDNSIDKIELNTTKENKVSVQKVTKLNNNEIEFC